MTYRTSKNTMQFLYFPRLTLAHACLSVGNGVPHLRSAPSPPQLVPIPLHCGPAASHAPRPGIWRFACGDHTLAYVFRGVQGHLSAGPWLAPLNPGEPQEVPSPVADAQKAAVFARTLGSK